MEKAEIGGINERGQVGNSALLQSKTACIYSYLKTPLTYAKPDLRNVRPPEEPVKLEPATLDLESLVEQLQKSPELASALAALIAAQAPAK